LIGLQLPSRTIRTFSAPDKKISIYVFGDEFTGKSIDEVVNTVDRLNRLAGCSGDSNSSTK
jgi:hypothetical protein